MDGIQNYQMLKGSVKLCGYTQACIYKSKYVKKRKFFDESLGKYSYLEDLFFSYNLNKYGRFALAPNRFIGTQIIL